MKEEDSDKNRISILKKLTQTLYSPDTSYDMLIKSIAQIEENYSVKLRSNIEEYIHKNWLNSESKLDYYYNSPKWVIDIKHVSFENFYEFLTVKKKRSLNEKAEPEYYLKHEKIFNDIFNVGNPHPSEIIKKKSIIETVYDLLPYENIAPEKQIILLDESSRVKRIITDIYRDNNHIFKINPNEFEDMVAELLRKQNFNTEITKRTRDGGYDIIAVQSLGDFPIRFLIECKRYSKTNKVGIGIVRSFRDVINTENANKGIIVTSSYFSPDAEDYRSRHSPYSLDFKDHDDVIRWVNKYID